MGFNQLNPINANRELDCMTYFDPPYYYILGICHFYFFINNLIQTKNRNNFYSVPVTVNINTSRHISIDASRSRYSTGDSTASLRISFQVSRLSYIRYIITCFKKIYIIRVIPYVVLHSYRHYATGSYLVYGDYFSGYFPFKRGRKRFHRYFAERSTNSFL